MADASPTSADPPGFRLLRRLGEDLWEAVQIDLDRRVALRRLGPGAPPDVTRWPQARGAVALYAVVETPTGTYVATRWVPGARTLAELPRARRATRRRWLDEVEATVAVAPHGDLTEHDILVDATGHALLTGFGRPVAADDRARIAALRLAGSRRPRLPLAAVPVGAAVVVVVAAAVVALARTGEDPAPSTVAVTPGATAFGSTLAPGAVRTVDCDGGSPGGSSPACTILQTDLRGRPLVAAFDGLVRGWAVRGARGPLRLQVLRPTSKGYVLYNATPLVTVPGSGSARLIPADSTVPKGSRFALEVAPGGAVGIRSGVAGAATARFFGPATASPRTPADPGRGEELLLRVDVVRAPG